MAERFGQVPPGRDITEITCDDVKIAPPGAVERVLNFGTPFQLIEHPLKDGSSATHFLDINLLRLQGAKETVQGVLYLVEDKTRDVTLRQELIAANAAKDQFSGTTISRVAQSSHACHRHGGRTRSRDAGFKAHQGSARGGPPKCRIGSTPHRRFARHHSHL